MPTDAASAARRAALDHVLALVAQAPWSAEVVLRGSRVLAAWYGARAREAADLDFVVLPTLIPPVDQEHRYPYLDDAVPIQQWPEAAGGAAAYELWRDGEEEHDHGGFHPRLAPEGLAWMAGPGPTGPLPLVEDLRLAIAQAPQAGPGVVLDAEGVRGDGSWNYAYDAYDDYDGGAYDVDGADPDEAGASEGDGDGAGGDRDRPRGVRVLVPWRAPGGAEGTVQLDFAQDDRMPEPAVWTMLPAAHRFEPLVVRTASRRVSLAWKLLWLHRDAVGGGAPLCKDLYDAVLLAEDPRTDLSERLLRTVVRDNRLSAVLGPGQGRGLGSGPVLGTGFGAGAVGPDERAWAEFRQRHPWVHGSAGDWLERLRAALAPVLEGSAAR